MSLIPQPEDDGIVYGYTVDDDFVPTDPRWVQYVKDLSVNDGKDFRSVRFGIDLKLVYQIVPRDTHNVSIYFN